MGVWLEAQNAPFIAGAVRQDGCHITDICADIDADITGLGESPEKLAYCQFEDAIPDQGMPDGFPRITLNQVSPGKRHWRRSLRESPDDLRRTKDIVRGSETHLSVLVRGRRWTSTNRGRSR